MKRIIFNADDFGYSKGVNLGILEAHRFGVVQSTTIMANMPGFEHGVALLNEYPSLRCGIHLTLSCYRPLLPNHKTLVNAEGYFHRHVNEELLQQFDLDEILAEYRAQIEHCLNAGIRLTHIDSHHHLHMAPRLRSVIKTLQAEYQLPIRANAAMQAEFPRSARCADGFYREQATLETLSAIIQGVRADHPVDVMTHPAYVDAFLLGSSSFTTDRCQELALLCDPRLVELLQQHGVSNSHYGEL